MAFTPDCITCSSKDDEMEEKEEKIKASIIIPTYNRADTIKKVVESLVNQTFPPDKYELVVVDDGSTDNTEQVIRSIKTSCSLRYFKQNRKGASAARNCGIKKARGEVIIFVDSDVVVNRYFVEEHVKSHQRDGIIVKGLLINTENIDNPASEKMKLSDISCAFFATGNVSIKKKYLLKAGLFDEDFKEYGWEDLELGLRLKKLGLKAITNRRAVGYHYRKKAVLADLPDLCEKERMRGRTAVLFYRKHPTLEVKLMTHISFFFFALDRMLNAGGWMSKKWAKNLLSWLEKHNSRILLSFFIKMITSHSYINGIREAINKNDCQAFK